MVRQGDFEVRLVDGEGRPIYKEHVDDKHNRGVFVEGEPDADYFIEVKRCPPDTKRRILEHPDDGLDGDNNKIYKLYFMVDDQNLGYSQKMARTGITKLIGVRSRSADGTETMRALQFMKAQASNEATTDSAESANNSVPFLSVCGKIQVLIYEAEKIVVTTETTPKKADGDGHNNSVKSPPKSVPFQSPFLAEDTVHMAADQSEEFGKKLLRSAVGMAAITTMPGKPHRRHSSGSTSTTTTYKKRAYVDTITLYYCSALGLIKAGILPSPEMYRLQQMVWAYNNNNSGSNNHDVNNNSNKRRRIVTPEKQPPVEFPQPEKIRVPINDDDGGGGGGEQQVLHREVWCFDLSQQSDGDDDAGNNGDDDDIVEKGAAVSQGQEAVEA